LFFFGFFCFWVVLLLFVLFGFLFFFCGVCVGGGFFVGFGGCVVLVGWFVVFGFFVWGCGVLWCVVVVGVLFGVFGVWVVLCWFGVFGVVCGFLGVWVVGRWLVVWLCFGGLGVLVGGVVGCFVGVVVWFGVLWGVGVFFGVCWVFSGCCLVFHWALARCVVSLMASS
ncbi:hypothetical protein, partial [Yersinia massiliensis]|uniref:hypothetical protein n=1 Tax=Yersinia massiliensis TaxID=419257 RepID=UPI001643905E